MVDEKKLPAIVSSGDSLSGDTSAPGAIDGDLLPRGTSDEPLGGPTESYTPTMAALLDKSLQNRRFFRPKFLNLLIAIGWFALIAYVLVSDQATGKLATIDDLKFFGLKAGIITTFAVALSFFVWMFGDKENQ